ncbi:uncharacterized protein LOC121039015 [Herpailurus yagouaroundi]|uniref:uncharacterized protein LOC121039015 n=1 Tax=Herpailurus yagouaroundi TaxID=1608482 RepID=UPI001AD731FA|nr:uncharacterized protein LOC121039015 [Puma yagouaroundi]
MNAKVGLWSLGRRHPLQQNALHPLQQNALRAGANTRSWPMSRRYLKTGEKSALVGLYAKSGNYFLCEPGERWFVRTQGLGGYRKITERQAAEPAFPALETLKSGVDSGPKQPCALGLTAYRSEPPSPLEVKRKEITSLFVKGLVQRLARTTTPPRWDGRENPSPQTAPRSRSPASSPPAHGAPFLPQRHSCTCSGVKLHCAIDGSGRPAFPPLRVLAAVGPRTLPVLSCRAWNQKRDKVQEERSSPGEWNGQTHSDTGFFQALFSSLQLRVWTRELPFLLPASAGLLASLSLSDKIMSTALHSPGLTVEIRCNALETLHMFVVVILEPRLHVQGLGCSSLRELSSQMKDLLYY